MKSIAHNVKDMIQKRTPEMENFIIQNYLDISIRELSRTLGIARPSIIRFLNKKGLKIPDEIKTRRIEKKQFVLSSSNVSVRKDKSGNSYNYIRISAKKWQKLSHYIWIQYNNEILKGYVIRHKNGNTLDDSIENLEMITRRANSDLNSASINLLDKYIAHTLAPKNKALKITIINNYPQLLEFKKNQLKLLRLCKQV